MENTSQSEQTVSDLRNAYAPFNRGDIDDALTPLDPQIEWSEPAEFPGGGTYHGLAGVKRYLTQSRAGFEEGGSEPEQRDLQLLPETDTVSGLDSPRRLCRLLHSRRWELRL